MRFYIGRELDGVDLYVFSTRPIRFARAIGWVRKHNTNQRRIFNSICANEFHKISKFRLPKGGGPVEADLELVIRRRK